MREQLVQLVGPEPLDRGQLARELEGLVHVGEGLFRFRSAATPAKRLGAEEGETSLRDRAVVTPFVAVVVNTRDDLRVLRNREKLRVHDDLHVERGATLKSAAHERRCQPPATRCSHARTPRVRRRGSSHSSVDSAPAATSGSSKPGRTKSAARGNRSASPSSMRSSSSRVWRSRASGGACPTSSSV